MKNKVLSVLLASAMVFSVAACGSSQGGSTATTDTPKAETQTATQETATTTETAAEPAAESTSELTDGKFAETRQITVEIYDRGNDGGSDPENNMYTEFIKKGMLEEHNVEVTFKKVPRWTEVDDINNLLAAQEAPDICVTYSYPTVLTYAQMGGVIDLSEMIETYKADTPNLWAWLGDTNMLWDKDPKTGTVWAIEGKRAEQQRIVTFVRKDWLDKLGLQVPTTTQEFEDMLIAFRDNADTLLGADASKMVPFSASYDIGWRASNIITSFMDPAITDKEYYINGFDDRMVTQASTKEAVRLLNKWYNADLMWKDFVLYGSGDTTEDDMIKAGYVGAFQHNWDYVFRNGEDSINSNLKRNVGEDAVFIPVDCFQNSAGKYSKWLYSSAGDRKIFFPSTNDEPLASLLYLDFISKPETIKYLQAGDEGVTHEVLDSGAIQIIAATGDAIQNSGKNIDYTITCNGTYFGDEALAALSLAYGYAEADPELVDQANKIAMADGLEPKNVNVGEITAEAGVGDTLSAKRDQIYDNAVVASEADFDSVWDSYVADYLSSGGQAIIDERTEKWTEYFGDADMLP
ncbi:sugar ABC transporter substrate-binding protein [Butyrivibrio sp. MC2021]|uniref:sugar ABC transporter substrate-binding protein n=1 Tax=Butyrivibrio sp. MC2021 TaxID=1408306 RepID=UPI00047B6156|nr:sugar ABC transporter substrate-binding protein [Butyrivibrio sp. MC2021]